MIKYNFPDLLITYNFIPVACYFDTFQSTHLKLFVLKCHKTSESTAKKRNKSKLNSSQLKPTKDITILSM